MRLEFMISADFFRRTFLSQMFAMQELYLDDIIIYARMRVINLKSLPSVSTRQGLVTLYASDGDLYFWHSGGFSTDGRYAYGAGRVPSTAPRFSQSERQF